MTTRRSLLIATASTGLTLGTGAALLLASKPEPAPKLPLAARVPDSITLRFDIRPSAAVPSLPASLQNQ